jgi:hypothetical protein
MTDRKELLQAIQAKKQEMKILQKRIIQMSRAYNSTSLASALPSDILFLIFREYLRYPTLKTTRIDPWILMRRPGEIEEIAVPYDSRFLYDPIEENPPHSRWLVLAGVCHTWQTVLLSSPLLWSRIEASIFRRPNLLEKFIWNSYNAPLDIHITDASFINFIGQADILRDSVKRIMEEDIHLKSLYLVFSLSGFQYFLLAYRITFSLSRLQSLDIRLDHSQVDDMYVSRPVLGFPAFMEANFQSLRHVALTDVYAEWKSLSTLPSTVTDLYITNRLQPSLIGPMNDVLDVLKKLVNLQKLALYDCLPPSTGRLTGLVHLLKLEKLTIAGDITRVMSLFDCLEHPPTTEICVGLDVHPGQEIHTASLSVLSRIRRIYEGHSDQIGASICVDRGYASVSLSADTVQHHELFLKLTGTSDDTQFSPLNLLCGALEAATARLFSFVTNLWLAILDHHTHDAPRLLSLVFQTFGRVESMSIEGQVTTLTEALRPKQDKPIPLPELYRLCLAETKIVEDTGTEHLGVLSGDTLYSCLKERKDHNCGLAILEFDDACTIHISAADEFRDRLETAVGNIKGWEEELSCKD